MPEIPKSMFRSLKEINVSEKALEIARNFAQAAQSGHPAKSWIICFDWGDSRRRREKNEPGKWIDLGPGMDLVAFERSQIPDEALQTVDGFVFAIKVPIHVLDQSQERKIDVLEGTRSTLNLL